MNGAEIHAQMAAELIDGNRSYTELAPKQKRVFLAGLASIGLLLGWRFHRRRLDFLDWRFVSIVFIVADAIVFNVAHLILPFTLAASAWLLSVTLGTQSWEALRWLLQKSERRT
jgi:CHASE2 domain-containing sensor protein